MYILVGWLAYRSSVNYLYKSYGRKNLIILYKKPLFKSYTLQFLLRPHIIFAIVKAFRPSLKNKAHFFFKFLKHNLQNIEPVGKLPQYDFLWYSFVSPNFMKNILMCGFITVSEKKNPFSTAQYIFWKLPKEMQIVLPEIII